MKRESYTPNVKRDGPWKGMTPVRRYEHHTLFYKRTASGEVYAECFLNIDIDGKVTYDE